MPQFLPTFAALILGLTISSTASSETFRILSSWDSSYAPVERVLEPFIQRLSEASEGKIAIQRSGPETIPPFEQLDPVRRGLFDMLFTSGAYHFNVTPVAQVLDALEGDPKRLRDSGLWEFVDQHYQERGLKLIAVLYDMNGYHILLRDPIEKSLLKGLRVRGTPQHRTVIEFLQGSPTVLPPSEIYPALERGVVDGATWPVIGAVGFRWFEVADYMLRPTFGQVAHPVFMNLERWQSLDSKMQKLISATAQEYELEAVEHFNDLVAEEIATLEREGMQTTEVPDGPYRDNIAEAWFNGSMDLAMEKDPVAIKQLLQLAREAGMTP